MVNQAQILVVAPYEGMYHLINQIQIEKKLENIKVVMGDLELGLEATFNEIKNGEYDLIISRGGTAELLINETSIPILEIPITNTDVMQALKLSENYNGQVAIVGYKSISSKAEQVCELMNWHPAIFTVDSKKEVEKVVDKLKKDGYSLVIGDVITTSYCKKVGLDSILISSSKDTLESTLMQAKILTNSLHNSRVLHKLCFEDHSNSNHEEYTLVYNRSGNLLDSSIPVDKVQPVLLEYLNTHFLEILELNYSRKDINIEKLHISLLTKQVNTGDRVYLVVRVKIIDTLKSTFPGLTIYDKNLLRTNYPSSINFFGEIRKVLQQSLHQNLPILITGETFTGKTSCINYLFSHGKFSNNLLYVFDCAKLTIEVWYEILTAINIKNLQNEVLCFLNLQSVSLSVLSEIKSLLETPSLKETNQFLFTYTKESNPEIALSEVTELLFTIEDFVIINLPSLRDRQQDLNNLITIHLNNLNSKYGKNVVGFEDRALDIIYSYNWPGNLKQFKRVLKKAVMATNGYYVSESSLKHILMEEETYGYEFTLEEEKGKNCINLDQYLNDIIYDIIETTLQSCEMNQKKTAEKLGISRSTVWRILKNGKQR